MRLDLRQNTAVCLFFDPDEAALNTLMARMKVRQQQLVQDPLSFIGLLFEGYGYATEEWRGALDEDVVKTESQTRMSSLNFVVASQIAAKHYETLTRDLHSCNTDLIFLDTMLAFELKFGEFCKKTTEKADRLRRLVTQAPLCNNLDEFNDNMDYLYNLCELRRNQTQSLRNRIQSQINVVGLLTSSPSE